METCLPTGKSYKVLTRILALRINPIIQDHGLEAHCGSLISKQCQDANFPLKSALQICQEHHFTTYILFVELVRSFDLVDHEFLWKISHRYGKATKVIPYSTGVHQ
eukprot:3427999-Ditylum_brightwellii.AAC.1